MMADRFVEDDGADAYADADPATTAMVGVVIRQGRSWV
jgi:hypothetical protein